MQHDRAGYLNNLASILPHTKISNSETQCLIHVFNLMYILIAKLMKNSGQWGGCMHRYALGSKWLESSVAEEM